MNTIREIKESYEEKRRKRIDEINLEVKKEMRDYQKEFEKEIKDYLAEQKLDGRVIRISDGKEGELQIHYNGMAYYNGTTFPELNFYPITKSGEVSVRASGWLDWNTDLNTLFKPKE